MAAPKVSVKIGDVELQQITSIQLRLAITELADSFSLTCADRLPIGQEGQRVEISVEGRAVLVGEVQTDDLDESGASRSRTFTGYSAAQRIVKSSYDGKRRLRDLSLKQIVQRVVEPYDLVVDVDSSAQDVASWPIPKVSADNGTSAFDFISKVAKRQGCILVSGAAAVSASEQPRSAIRITRAATRRAPFVLTYPSPRFAGIRYSSDIRDVFSVYIVRRRGNGTLGKTGTPSALEGLAFDDLPFSPIVIPAEKGGTSQDELDRQAEWEMRRRAAEGTRVALVHYGWSPNDSQALWWPNLVWRLVDTNNGVDRELVMSAVNLSYDTSSGATATLELMPPDAYAVLAEPTRPRPKPGAPDPAKGFIKAGKSLAGNAVSGLQAIAQFTVNTLADTADGVDVSLSRTASKFIAKPKDPNA